ncbi:hypothetical protein G6O69_04040 [Pseudenhygromyxa sp. WMMC2535]|uniref:aKG-HExxH-type peptide beta-hydroxylase n=1 Tax=Pseudenhygromyxa sp. WMMC2535 TaxID=2712867 RepID=UPI00155807C1|nr:HEXXH motif-containing putative peptide modification protein [Pseudenhygromyxa sp. WMMC2535]NVB36987.1 hypothetical protein [Pseudenhygromyxa sp. WMMC2535]
MSKPSIATPRDITVPEDESSTARDTLSLALRRSLRDLMRLCSLADPQLQAFKPSLEQLLARAPGALVSALRAPTIGGLLRCLRRRAPEVDFDAGVAELLATLATDLAVLGALPAPLSFQRLPKRIVSRAARRCIEVPAGARGLTIENAKLRFQLDAGREPQVVEITLDQPAQLDPSPAFAAITPTLDLALVDNNPLAMSEAHPDKQGNALELGGRPASEWTASIADALARIGRYMPTLRGEIDLYLQQIVPVGYDEHAHLSASYQEVIGTIYMSLHPQHMTMVEATIHEFQHNKLHALLELDPLLHNAFSPLYASPVRPDPRPLQGVLLAVHAFVPVARLYQLMRAGGDPIAEHPEFDRRYRQIVAGNHEGSQVLLEHGQPTAVGRGVLEEIRRWDDWDWGV